MPVRLIPATSGKPIKLDKPVVLIGRNPDCDVILTKSRKVSRNHCLVACVNNHIVVRDLGSTNGVWVNGQRVEREARVRLGDELSVADVRYHLVNVDAESNGKPRKKKKQRQEVVAGDQPVPLPEEDDSFVVEASSPRLPRVRPDDIAADEADDEGSCDVIPLEEDALSGSHAPDALIPLDVPDTGSEMELLELDERGLQATADSLGLGDDDEDESEEAFSILDSGDDSDDIIPLAPIDDD